MRILVISDSHGRDANIYKVVKKIQPDAIFHLGDVEGQADAIRANTKLPLDIVRGNCDFTPSLPKLLIKEVGDRKILLVHGNAQCVNYGPEGLMEAAWENGCDTVLYGHTHVPELREEDGITIMNPGSISCPRQDGHIPSYGVINVENGKCDFAVRYMDWTLKE